MKIKFIFLLLFIPIIVTFCSRRSEMETDGQKISKILEDAVRNKRPLFTLASLRSDWDSVIFLHPYSNSQAIGKSFDIDLHEISSMGIEQRDDICVLVFVKREKIRFYMSFGRGVFDFAELPTNKFFTSNDKFQLIPDKSAKKPRFFIRPYESGRE